MVYSDLIRERFRHPRYQGSLERPDAAFEDVNPLCGDRIRIECRLADGRVTDALRQIIQRIQRSFRRESVPW